MRLVPPFLLATLALAGPAMAAPLAADGRVETVEWSQDTEIPLRTTLGGHVVLIFAPGEAIRSVLVGDPGAVEVRVAPQADSISLYTARQPSDTSIRVETQLRSYRFSLAVGPANNVAYAIRFSIPAPHETEMKAHLPPPGATYAYAIKGKPVLRPVKVSDDGQKTYIEWNDDQVLPAVFAVNALGDEETVDGYMRGGVMVIDRVYPRLVFRIGKLAAQATRISASKRGRS